MFSGCVFPFVVMICTSGPLQNCVICLKTITWATGIRWVSSLHTDYINTVINAVTHCSDDLCGIMKFSFTPLCMSLLFTLWNASSWIHEGGSCWLATLELCHTEASLALITARRLLSLQHPVDSYCLLCFMITISQKLVAYTGRKKKMAIAQTSQGHL